MLLLNSHSFPGGNETPYIINDARSINIFIFCLPPSLSLFLPAVPCALLTQYYQNMMENSEMICLLMHLFLVVPFRMQMWSLNTYLYGPKDDLKHRLLWREVYSAEEEGMLFIMPSIYSNYSIMKHWVKVFI